MEYSAWSEFGVDRRRSMRRKRYLFVKLAPVIVIG